MGFGTWEYRHQAMFNMCFTEASNRSFVMKDQELRKLARGLGRALKAKQHAVPHSVLLHAMAAIIGSTDWHVLTAGAKASKPKKAAVPAVPYIELGSAPLSIETLKRLEAQDDIRAIVEIELNDIIDGDLEVFLDSLSERITGSECGLGDLSYRVVHSGSSNTAAALALQVHQNLTDWKSDKLKDHGLDALLESANAALDEPKGLKVDDGTIAVEVTAGQVYWEGLGEDLDDEEQPDLGVPAESHSDDRVVEVSFDAAPWFKRATDEEIIKLANCGFGGDYPADEVSMGLAGQIPELSELHNYIGRVQKAGRDCGFECHVDRDAALAWIKAHRPALLDKIEVQD
jgi:hypothetical protein